MKSLTVMDFGDRPPEIYHYANGDVFKGHLDSNNLRQGSGVYTEHRMGSTYEGEMVALFVCLKYEAAQVQLTIIFSYSL
jgi:hypothetical protein